MLPILFLDFLVVALPRSVTPRMMDARYGVAAYTYLGYADAVRGTLAFGSAPLLGALSDRWGRRGPFLACVVGTASPSVVLALSHSLDAYLVAIALSGALSATLPLTFALIADEVPPARRSEAFGLALGCGCAWPVPFFSMLTLRSILTRTPPAARPSLDRSSSAPLA